MLTRDQALTRLAFAARRHGAAVFIGNGLNPRALRMLADRRENFYMVGSMGLALALAIGFGRRAGVATIAVEGDGNALMGLPAMPLVPAAHRPLAHVILDNQQYESTGGQRSPAPGFAFVEVARAAGYSMAVRVEDDDELAGALHEAMDGGHLGLIHARTTPDAGDPPPRIPWHPAEITDRFTAGLREAVGP